MMRSLDSCICGEAQSIGSTFLPPTVFLFLSFWWEKPPPLMMPRGLLLILRGFCFKYPVCSLPRIPMHMCRVSIVVRKPVVSACVNREANPRGGSGSRMRRIHVHSSSFSNPESPHFPSQLLVSMWEPVKCCSGLCVYLYSLACP